MLRLSAIAGAIVASSMLAGVANAADVPPCGPRTELVKAMKQIFDEQPRARGLLSSKELFEVFVSPDGTWTILVTNPHGISCIAAAGDNWERAPGQLAQGLSSMD